MDSQVTHILARQGHAYTLKWHDGLEKLRDLLQVAPYIYRYVDTSIEPCVYLEATLKGRPPQVPSFLTAQESFQTMIKTGQQLGACPKLGSGSTDKDHVSPSKMAQQDGADNSTLCDRSPSCPGPKVTAGSTEPPTRTCSLCRKVKLVEIFERAA